MTKKFLELPLSSGKKVYINVAQIVYFVESFGDKNKTAIYFNYSGHGLSEHCVTVDCAPCEVARMVNWLVK